MKKIISVILCLGLAFCVTACGGNTADDRLSASSSSPENSKTETVSGGKTLVVYYSATGSTKAVAEKIAKTLNADIFELVPEKPYTSADLNWNDDNSRVSLEHSDESKREVALVKSTPDNWEQYDTVYVGYPIWWGTMPRIINTFLDTYDLSGKTVLPFCTSGSSGITQSVTDIRTAEPDANVRDGLRASGANDSSIENWIADNGISE